MGLLSRWLGPTERPEPLPEPPRSREPEARRSLSPQHLTASTFDAFVGGHAVAVVDVWAPWCGPCRAFAPVFAAASKEWGDAVGFGKVHADRERELAARLEVRSIPSLLIYRDGELVRRETGAISLDRLESLLRKAGAPIR